MVAVLPVMFLGQFEIETPDWALWITMALGGAWGIGYGYEILKRQADGDARRKANEAGLKARFGIE